MTDDTVAEDGYDLFEPKPMGPRLYISGTISSNPGLSFEQAKELFDDARDTLRALHYDAISPTDMEGECGRTPAECVATQKRVMPGQGQGNHSWECYLKGDLRAMLLCDGVALLPNWHLSAGARLEFNTAVAVGLDVRPLDEWPLWRPPFLVESVTIGNQTFSVSGTSVVDVDKFTPVHKSQVRCARCNMHEFAHTKGGARAGCDFAGPGTQTRCRSCAHMIVWDGEKWQAASPADGGWSAFCAGSTQPDVAHEPVDAGDLR